MPHKKSSRYEAAHRALLDRSGKLPPETPPDDLKIQTLEQAAAYIHARIQEAQECADQLLRCLADRSAHPGEYQDYQREKWRTDRRLAALRVLMESARVPCQTIPRNPEYETTSLPARKQANLSSFFQRGSRKAPLHFNCAVTGRALERRVLKQVSPLVLKPSTPTRTSFLSLPSNSPPLYARRRQSEKMINTTSTRDGHWALPSPSYSASEDTSTSSYSPKTPSDDDMGTTYVGIAIILSPVLRSEEEIIAEMEDVMLPAYVLHLLEDLDDIRPGSLLLDGSPSPLIVGPKDWDYPPRDSPIPSPTRTATIRIPDRNLADALLTSPEIEVVPRKRGRAHRVCLDPTFFKDDSTSEKLGEVAPIRHSVHVPAEEEEKKPMSPLKKKSSTVFSIVSRTPSRRGETTPPTPRKNIASLVKRRMSSISRFR